MKGLSELLSQLGPSQTRVPPSQTDASCLSDDRQLITGIGPGRSGTSTIEGLFTLMAARGRGKITVARATYNAETHYWLRPAARGAVAGFCRYFAVTNATVALFEKSPTYASARAAPLNLLAHVPRRVTLRFIFTVREVSEQLWSNFVTSSDFAAKDGVSCERCPDLRRFLEAQRGEAIASHACLLQVARSKPFAASLARLGLPASVMEEQGAPSAPSRLPALVCALAALPPELYRHFSERSRRCRSSQFLWLSNLVHWSRLVGENRVLVVPHRWLRERQPQLRTALLRFSGLDREGVAAAVGAVPSNSVFADRRTGGVEPAAVLSADDRLRNPRARGHHRHDAVNAALLRDADELYAAMNGARVEAISSTLWLSDPPATSDSRGVASDATPLPREWLGGGAGGRHSLVRAVCSADRVRASCALHPTSSLTLY